LPLSHASQTECAELLLVQGIETLDNK
jgi:hypothetical protein